MAELKYGEINDDVLSAMQKPGIPYFFALAFLAVTLGWGALCWLYQTQYGMGVTGLNRPVGWAVYITNFVFWVGIAHSGTLISAILYLLRADWRNAVSRSSEAMTIFAIMTAGLFPLIHLGRLWAFYYIIPYPSQRTIWPNFVSPLVWDVCAVGTYFTVSLIFWLVGLIPDLAAARDLYLEKYGPESFRYKLYRVMSVGWSGAGSQWHHYGRSYLFFAALATPLVVSVHSVVSWDFAMSLLPGWHSAIFPPYFVAGAIHSGLAMVLTLLIPMRKLLHLERLIQMKHFEALAKTTILTASIVGYAYVMEAFIDWYSGDKFDWQLFLWRTFGTPAWMYWLCIVCNVLIPLLFCFKKMRTNLATLFVISLFINLGMWFERLFIIYSSLAHDFLPHNWEPYHPTWVEISITVGSFGFFFFWFFGFTKLLPTVPLTELKEKIAEEELEPVQSCRTSVHMGSGSGRPNVLAVFASPARLLEGAKRACDAGFQVIETYSPVKIEKLNEVLAQPKSPVRIITLMGALAGLAGGFWLAGGTALVQSLIVGGKPPLAYIPFCVVGFEGTILLGSLANLGALIFYSRLTRLSTAPYYDSRFSRDKFALVVTCEANDFDRLKELLDPADPEEIHVHH
ncbi:quinol:electron acceptor oxidoreductase subunit ActD [Geomonas sp.]|uniref:quinol:electron acceptor oxidoreductase subunit ActD n=1 Tax=Geomonas sp. TaxID=2651584 RepID=UPI002B48B7EF|nr:quinol:electron acceptor oxidoreductase subunit ActD [Geomonas sp.]HJV34183.1 quinol:electron acceptor oxidoreductase subunit ActD [Geomonas sp.]